MKLGHRNTFRLLTIGMLGALSAFACAGQPPYSMYEVTVTTPQDVKRLGDSPLRIMEENVRPGKLTVALRRGEELQLAMLKLPTRYLGEHEVVIPDPHADADYRNEYLNYDQLMAEWDGLMNAYPWLVTKRQIGLTRESRPIYAYRIYRPEASDVLNPPKSILILGDTHAREWISPSAVLHSGKMLVQTLASQDSTFTARLVDKVGVWIVPVFNVDGYIYSWTTDRFWRKNRRNNGNNIFGVDLNRNYDKAWGGAGSSGVTSSETYRGPSAASEPELQSLKAFAATLPPLLGFIDFHTYAGDILYPWSYTTTSAPAADVTIFSTVGNAIKNAILARAGTNYQVGQGGVILYLAAGASKDYFYDTYHIPAYTIEIAGTQFDPPPTTITPSQDDVWVGFKAFIEAVAP